MVTILITVFIGLTCIVFSYLIGKRQMVEILAGYNPEKVTDREGLGRWVGTNLILMGILAFVSAGLMAIIPEVRGTLFLVYVLGAVPLLYLRIVLGNRRFFKK